MKTAEVLACCLLIASLAGPAPHAGRHSRAKPQVNSPESSVEHNSLIADLRAGGDLFRAGRFHDAAARFNALAERARGRKDLFVAARATGNAGGCLFALHQYQPALSAFLQARRIAEAAGDSSAIAAFDTNIASLYTEMGDFEAAARWIEGARERLWRAEDRRAHLGELLIQLATIRARQYRWTEALGLFREGIDAADRAGNLNLYAIGWNRYGEELLKGGDLAGAERALLESFRVRKLNRLPLDSSYRNLGRLRLEQGHLRSASSLLDRAVELSSGPRGSIPTWDLYHYRGRVRLGEGKPSEALSDLRTAVRLGRAWRWSGASDDAGRMGEEGWLNPVHAALIEAGNRLYFATGNEALPRETFEALEENRASSLRLLRAGRDTLPPSYWEALLRLQQAEVQALRSGRAGDEAAAAKARAEVVRAELAAVSGTAANTYGELLPRVQAALPAGTALLSFALGENASWLWAVDRHGVKLYQLPGRDQVAAQVAAASIAVQQGQDGSTALSDLLFGRLDERFRRSQRWLLALDDALFDAPLAALPVRHGAAKAYLVELHSMQVIPGAGWWLEAAPPLRVRPAALFLGIGDPIYNGADERQQSRPLGGGHLRAAELLLPRLVASGPELDACAAAWAGEHTLLKGAAACRRNLVEQLHRNPAVVHFATHILESADGSAGGRIALSLSDGGEPQVLTAAEIARWRLAGGLIVLSGCQSAAGPSRPGTGLLGLTRAWLAAGAGDVIGSRWATADDTGTLFSSLYRHLRAPGQDAAQALRAAQMDMLRAGGWRARPRYWGAYFAMGSERLP